jgi:hypothetical protein
MMAGILKNDNSAKDDIPQRQYLAVSPMRTADHPALSGGHVEYAR